MSTILFILHCYLFELDDKVIMKPLQKAVVLKQNKVIQQYYGTF